jgi:hypothetical protein
MCSNSRLILYSLYPLLLRDVVPEAFLQDTIALFTGFRWKRSDSVDSTRLTGAVVP